MLQDWRAKCLFCGWGSCKNGRMMDKWFFPFETHGSFLVSKQYQRTTDGIQSLHWTKAITRPYWNYISCHWLQFPISLVILRPYRIIRQSHHTAGTFKCCTHLDHGKKLPRRWGNDIFEWPIAARICGGVWCSLSESKPFWNASDEHLMTARLGVYMNYMVWSYHRGTVEWKNLLTSLSLQNRIEYTSP